MLIDLSDPIKIEIKTMGGWSEELNLRTGFKISRLFFQAEHGYRQHLKIEPRWLGDDHYPHEYTIMRPATLIPGVTKLCVQHNAKHTWASAWPARFDRELKIVLWQVHAKRGTWEDDPKTAFWVSLWGQMEEDRDQLSFDWSPRGDWDLGRFDLIG